MVKRAQLAQGLKNNSGDQRGSGWERCVMGREVRTGKWSEVADRARAFFQTLTTLNVNRGGWVSEG